MEAPVEQRKRFTVQEYLRIEENSIEKHEYRDGEIVAMAGGTYEQSLIIANIVGELRNRLRGGPCRAVESNLRVRMGRSVLYSYPDASVICGPPQFDPLDSGRKTILNPRLIVEVLSSSTEAYDRGEKFNRYRQIESFEEYVLVAQDQPSVEVFFRQSDGTWLFSPYSGVEAIARIRSLQIDLPLSEVYAGVEFAASGAEPSASQAV